MQRGLSTIELMIAMAILVVVMSAVVIVSFGNQAFLSGTQSSSEALIKAQELLEQEQALGRKDFNLVNPIASTTDGIFEKAVYVNIVNDDPAKPSYLTKEVKAIVAWRNERGATSTMELTTLVANFDSPIGNNTCDSTLSGNWQNPVIESTVNFSTFNGATLSDVDAYRGRLYVTAIQTTAASNPTLFVFDITGSNPSLIGSADNAPVTTGLNAVRVAEDPAASPVKKYAYAASGAANNYSSCNPVTNLACGQLAVFDVTNSSPVMKANLMLASSSAPSVKGSQALGNSIFYKNGYILLGLAATGAGNGPEFHLVDFHNITNLFTTGFFTTNKNIIYPAGSYAVGNFVNAITMRGTYAYIATPNTQELQTINMTNPNSLTLAGGYNSPSGAGNGKSLYLAGNNLYLGITVPNSGVDLHILDNTTPGSALTAKGGIDLPQSVNGVLQRDYLSFILTNSDLRIYRTDNPSAPSAWGAVPQLTLPQSGSATEPSMDCEGNKLYITSNDSSGRGYLYVVKPGT